MTELASPKGRMTARRIRGAVGLASAACVLLAVPAGAAPSGPSEAAQPAAQQAVHQEAYPVPPNRVFTFHGRGYGHGHGMSQWGAYAAAKVHHMSARQILHFYYPHTSLVTRSPNRMIRVLLSAVAAPSRGYVQVSPSDGLTADPVKGKPVTLPTQTAGGHPITAWRLLRTGSSSVVLQEHTRGHWHTKLQVGRGATFTDTASVISVSEPIGTVPYHGAIVGEIESGFLETVNVVKEEQYLRGVVPAEMPPSWSSQAVLAQAIASRSYATHATHNPKASWYDIDGDNRDQAYLGIPREAPQSDKLLTASAGQIVVDSAGHAILAQFGAADGGWTVGGTVPYLPAEHDPYDGDIPNPSHAWTSSVSAGTLESVYPQLGHLQQITISGRDGHGLWGGRVTALTLVGSKASVPLTGEGLEFAVGLRSPWFRPVPVPAAPRGVTATPVGRTIAVHWKPPNSERGAAAVAGYRVEVSPGNHHQRRPASARSASVSKLPAGRYTVTVVALSSAGRSQGASVIVKTVHK